MELFRKMPDAAVFLFITVALAALCTWVVPAGEYARYVDAATGNLLVTGGTYHRVAPSPVGLMQFLSAVPRGLQDAAGIVFFVVLIGGAMQVVNQTGALNALTAALLTWRRGRGGRTIIFVLTFFFGFCASSFGFCSEGLIFIPLVIKLYRRLGYDAVAAVATVMCASATGYAAAPMNAFNVGIAQGIAGLPLFSGLGFRSVLWLVMFVVLALFIAHYAERSKKDPSKSVLADLEAAAGGADRSACSEDDDDAAAALSSEAPLTRRQVAVLLLFLATIVYLIVAASRARLREWHDFSAIFLALGIGAGVIGGMDANRIAKEFVVGCQTLLFAAITVGMARSVGLLLEEGKVVDTMVYYLFKPMEGMSGATYLGGIFMFWAQGLLNVVMPTNSGQAMATMPIMLPLSDLVGLKKQIAVLAFQLGDGLTMTLFPTFGVLTAALALAKIPFMRWLKFLWKLLALQVALAMAAIAVAIWLGLGPF